MRTIIGEDRRMNIAGTIAPRLGLLLASAVLLAGCISAPPLADAPPLEDVPPLVGPAYGSGPPEPPESVAPGECPPSGVVVRAGAVDAAMGLRAMRLELVNCGTVDYTVNGYPDVRVLDEDGKPLDVTVVRGSSTVASIDRFDTPPAPVTARPGEWLVVGLVWRNTVTDGVVEPVSGMYLEVVPAPGQPPQTVRPDGRVDLGTTGRLGVTAWGVPRK
jgi:hypothetical protein